MGRMPPSDPVAFDPGLPADRQTVTHPGTDPGLVVAVGLGLAPCRESNSQPVDHKSDALTTTPTSHKYKGKTKGKTSICIAHLVDQPPLMRSLVTNGSRPAPDHPGHRPQPAHTGLDNRWPGSASHN